MGKSIRMRKLLRSIGLALLALLALAIFLALDPPALEFVLRAAPIPGSVTIPTPGPTPPLPTIQASSVPVPDGFVAFTGAFEGGSISCGFLLALDDGVVGVTAAHASPRLEPGAPAEFLLPDGRRAAALTGQTGFGRTFTGDRLDTDYALWAVDPAADPLYFLQPDPRPLAQPGEPVYLFAPSADGAGGPLRRPGVVVSAAPNAIWVQMDDSFSPVGYSGCPVVSRVTGKLVGMAVAGADLHPVVIGLHPAVSLVAKARAALAEAH